MAAPAWLLVAVALLAFSSTAYSMPYAAPTLELRQVEGELVPIQNGVVYPNFALQRQSRKYLDLGGEWEILYDEASGALEVDGVRLSLAARTPQVLELMERQLREALAKSGWRRVKVPHSNNARGSDTEGYQGVVWYRKVFELPRGFLEQGGRAFLVFQGVNYLVDVWLNGKYLGYHEGGFTPFLFDVSNSLVEGVNELVLRVDNVPWDAPGSRFLTVPYRRCDWWNYGGVYRDVYIEVANSTYIARLDLVASRSTEGWILAARAVIVSKSSVRALLRLRLHPADAAGRLEPDAYSLANKSAVVGEVAGEIDLIPGINVVKVRLDAVGVREWSPEEPNLYVLAAELWVGGSIVDSVYEQVGFREVGVAGGKILLNGKTVFLKGLSRHEDYPVLGRALTPELIYGDLLIVKELSANFLRTAHYPNHPLTYVYADRLGLLVWEEIPVYWFDCEAFRVQLERGVAKQMLLEMIFRDFNRPSIIIWSLANECACRGERINFLKEMAQAARLVDPTRLLTQAIAWDLSDDTSLKAGLDLLAVNMYFGVFYGKLEDMGSAIKSLKNRYPELPLVISEIGYWSGGGVGEAGQAEYFIRAWRIIEANAESLAGAAWWTVFDYDSMIVFNTFGALDWQRSRRKLLYYEIKKAFELPLSGGKDSQGLPPLVLVCAALLLLASLVAILKVLRLRRRRERSGSEPARRLTTPRSCCVA